MTMAERQPKFDEHAETYRGFIRGSIAVILGVTNVLIALASVAFGSTLPVFLAFAGIILGHIAIAIDLRTGSPNWGLSLGFLAVYALITAVNVY